MAPTTTTTASTSVAGAPGTAAGRGALLAGATGMSGLLAGLAPFGLVVGMTAAASPDPAAALAGTWLIYSGSAHLAVVGGLSAGATLPAVVAAGLLVNVRLLALSASLAPDFRAHRLGVRAALAALLVDPLWALATARAPRHDATRYYVGAGVLLWCAWAVAVAVGALLGAQPALARGAAVGVPLCLLALVIPHARARSGLAVVAAGATVGLVSAGWPAGTGVLAGMVAGAVAGAAARRRSA